MFYNEKQEEILRNTNVSYTNSESIKNAFKVQNYNKTIARNVHRLILRIYYFHPQIENYNN
jgi:hypothetical protein